MFTIASLGVSGMMTYVAIAVSERWVNTRRVIEARKRLEQYNSQIQKSGAYVQRPVTEEEFKHYEEMYAVPRRETVRNVAAYHPELI